MPTKPTKQNSSKPAKPVRPAKSTKPATQKPVPAGKAVASASVGMDGPVVSVFYASTQPAGTPTVIGVPLADGWMKSDDESLALIAPSGARLPVAGRVLSRHKSGNVWWLLLSFLSTEKGDYRLEKTTSARAPKVADPVTVEHHATGLLVKSDRVRIAMAVDGAGPVSELSIDGRNIVARPDDLRFVVDSHSTLHETSRSIRLLENSPIRVRARVEGGHFDLAGKRKLNYRLDIEVWSGWPSVRFDYHFFNLEPGQDVQVIQRMALELDLDVASPTHRHFKQVNHTVSYVPREVLNPSPVAIVSDGARFRPHVEHESMLLDASEYNFHVRPPLIDTQDWFGVVGADQSVYLHMQDFNHQRPKRMASAANHLALEFWPEFAGDNQKTGGGCSRVDGKGPNLGKGLHLSQGRSRRSVFSIASFADGPAKEQEILSHTEALWWEGRACVHPQWLVRQQVFQQEAILPVGKSVRYERFLRKLVQLTTPSSMWDLGDTPDSGYSSTYMGVGNAQDLKPGFPDVSKVFSTSSFVVPWMLNHAYEPVWTNNEYDVIHALASEVMRTGRYDQWTNLRWFARHNIEVDFVHYSDHAQQHRSTPQHSACHNRSGSIPSHFWAQGLMEYYCLTGDEDALEIGMALGDKIIEDLADPVMRKGFFGFTRELGWPTLTLSYLAQVTGEERYAKQVKEIVDFFVGYDRKSFTGAVKLSSGDDRHSLERQMVLGFFAYGCMIEGVDHHVKRTGDKAAEAWLVTLLHELRDAAEQCFINGDVLDFSNQVPLAMAIGYERTGDKRFLRAGLFCLEAGIDGGMWHEPRHEVKPVATAYRGLIRFLGTADRTGLLEKLEYQTLSHPEWFK
jgi:hypothetical protein